jgi:hypothetical protein
VEVRYRKVGQEAGYRRKEKLPQQAQQKTSEQGQNPHKTGEKQTVLHAKAEGTGETQKVRRHTQQVKGM